MKNKLNKLLLITSAVLMVSIFVLSALSSVNRIGYLSDFQLNRELSKKNEYHYGFRIKYHSKIFRNSDIYGVYVDTNKIIKENHFIKEIKMEKVGSPFGNLISEKKLGYNEKIDNINYKLKVKFTIYLIFILILIILMILLNVKYFNTIICSPKNSDYIIFSIITILCFFSYIYSDVLVVFPFSVNFFNVNPLNFFMRFIKK